VTDEIMHGRRRRMSRRGRGRGLTRSMLSLSTVSRSSSIYGDDDALLEPRGGGGGSYN
jgi:hypothetical protein